MASIIFGIEANVPTIHNISHLKTRFADNADFFCGACQIKPFMELLFSKCFI